MSQDDWVYFTLEAPPEVVFDIINYMQTKHNFPQHETDWCENERNDFALYTYAPVNKNTKSRYA